MIETIKKEVYKTSDGKEFIDKQDASEHQEYLDTPKVYLLVNKLCNSILLATLNYNKVVVMKKSHQGIGISIETCILQ